MPQADDPLITPYDLVSSPRWPNKLDLAHLAFLRAIAANIPEPLNATQATAGQLRHRAAIVGNLFAAFRAYMARLLVDTSSRSPTPIDIQPVVDGIGDLGRDASALINATINAMPR
jgi:hypothetical protein